MPTLTEAVSNRPWSDFTAADYTPKQWRAACLIDTGQGGEDSKGRYSLPVKEPDGTLNRNGVHAAAGAHGVGAVKGISADDRKAAAKKLVSLYRNQLKEDPPGSLLALAGEQSEAAAPQRPAGTVTLTEASATLTPTSGGSGMRRYRARLIEGDRWGSSGYYPADVLKRDGPQAWPAGTLMYLDHPSLSEAIERPERSVRDLAGRIASTPSFDGDGLYADIEVFPHAQPVIDGMAESIGLSIRADGTAEQGEVAGRTGPVVTSITQGRSVDFVTKAGAGGKLVALLEAARDPGPIEEAASIATWVESRLHLALTSIADDMYGCGQMTRAERIALSSAVGDALDAFTATIQKQAPTLYTRDQWGDPAVTPIDPDGDGDEDVPGGNDPDGDAAQMAEAARPASAAEAMRRVHNAPTKTTHGDGTPPAATTQLTEGAVMPENNTGQPAGAGGTGTPDSRHIALGEAERLTQLLTEARTAVTEANNARETALAEAEAAKHEALVIKARYAAEQKVRGELGKSALTEASYQGVVDAVCDSLTVDEAGKVDDTKLSEAITAEIDKAARREAAILEAHGAGVPKGLGVSGDPQHITDAQLTESLGGIFGELGLDDKAAKIAAKGR